MKCCSVSASLDIVRMLIHSLNKKMLQCVSIPWHSTDANPQSEQEDAAVCQPFLTYCSADANPRSIDYSSMSVADSTDCAMPVPIWICEYCCYSFLYILYYIQYILVLMFALFNEIYAALMTISKLLQVLQEFLQKVAVNKPFRLCNLSLVFRGNEAAEAGNMKERRPLN